MRDCPHCGAIAMDWAACSKCGTPLPGQSRPISPFCAVHQMTIINGYCVRCEAEKLHRLTTSADPQLTEDELQDAAETAQDARRDEFYGSSRPQTVQETYQAAAAEKRRLR